MQGASLYDVGSMPPASLLLASQNAGKLNEMRQLVAGLRFEGLSPRDLGITLAAAVVST